MIRGRELKTLILPKIVEARKRVESDMDSPNSTLHCQHLSRSSTLSDSTSPTTPTLSARGHSRLPSSTSSLASSPTMRESIDGYGSAKRPLTDVREEPQDKEEDYEMINGFDGRRSYEEEVPSMTSDPQWGLYQPTTLEFSSAYDFPDDSIDSDFAPNPCAKRRCSGDSPLSPMDGLTSRLGSRMPSFSRSLSRKFRSRKASPTIAMPPRSQEPSRSRANSTRAPSLASSTVDAAEIKGTQFPPTPRRSMVEDRFEDAYMALIDVDKANAPQDEEEEVIDCEAKPTTPLLPPILTQLPAHIREIPYQSPLQSPTVADPEASSVLNSPLPTPQMAGLPSPPLSSKPSVSSFHRQRGLGAIAPSAEIPSMLISDPDDKWADRLGHANFTMFPEPYVAESTTLVACKQLRTDWETARSKYMKHLVRTGENYGATSKIYRLTEEKWAEIDGSWKRNVELSFSRIPQLGSETATSAPHVSHSDSAPEQPSPLVKVSSSEGPKNNNSPMTESNKFPTLGAAKFPTVGEEGIVGPMEVVAPQEPRRRKRKQSFFRWVQGVWPTGAGALARRSSR